MQRLTILIFIKNGKHLLQVAGWYQVDVALVVAKQSPAYQSEFGERQTIVAEIKKKKKNSVILVYKQFSGSLLRSSRATSEVLTAQMELKTSFHAESDIMLLPSAIFNLISSPKKTDCKSTSGTKSSNRLFAASKYVCALNPIVDGARFIMLQLIDIKKGKMGEEAKSQLRQLIPGELTHSGRHNNCANPNDTVCKTAKIVMQNGQSSSMILSLSVMIRQGSTRNSRTVVRILYPFHPFRTVERFRSPAIMETSPHSFQLRLLPVWLSACGCQCI